MKKSAKRIRTFFKINIKYYIPWHCIGCKYNLSYLNDICGRSWLTQSQRKMPTISKKLHNIKTKMAEWFIMNSQRLRRASLWGEGVSRGKNSLVPMSSKSWWKGYVLYNLGMKIVIYFKVLLNNVLKSLTLMKFTLKIMYSKGRKMFGTLFLFFYFFFL